MPFLKSLLRDLRNAVFVILAGGVPPVVVVYLGTFFVKGDAIVPFIYAGMALGLVGIAVTYWIFFWIHADHKQVQHEKELAVRMQAGEVFGTEKTETLTEDDVAQIRTLKWCSTIVLAVVFGVFTWFAYLACQEMSAYPWQGIIPAAFALGSAFLIYKFAMEIEALVTKGIKNVATGTITRKARKARVRGYDYYFELGTLRIKVFRHIYQSYHVGDPVELHFLRTYGDWLLQIRGKDQ